MNERKIGDSFGRRIRWAREKAGLTQTQVAERLGFKDRQTLSSIEAGQRKVTADELVLFMEVFGVDFNRFTDPYQLIDEPAFSWRAREAPETLDAFEEKMRPVVALYRQLGVELGDSTPALVPQLPLDARSRFEDAAIAAEKLGAEWKLGDVPAAKLAPTAEDQLGLLALMIDAPDEVSGAALALADLPVILVNRREPAGRRHYDFAHELFHILTWRAMPPPERDLVSPSGYKAKRVEQLAESFAAALLMPERVMRQLAENRPKNAELHEWARKAAAQLLVSGQAFYYRLKTLDLLRDGDEAMEPERLSRPDGAPKPKLYSRRFMERLKSGIAGGHVSARRSASILDLKLDGLARLFRAYGLKPPFEP